MIQFVLYGFCRNYDELPEGAAVVSVNGRDSLGECDACGKPILVGSLYVSYPEGMVHKRCGG